MTGSHSTPDERTKLEACLTELSHDGGVWRKDLVDLLQGDLSRLRRRWMVNADDGIDIARRIVVTSLGDHIRRLYPRRGNRLLTEASEVKRYRFVVAACFNILDSPSELHQINLQKRQEWVAGQVEVSARTVRRMLKEAIKQIAEQLANGSKEPPVDLPIDGDEPPKGAMEPVVQIESQGARSDWLLPFIPASSILVPAVVLSYTPATLWEPLKSANAAMPWLVGPCAVGWLLIRILTDRPRWLRLGSILLIIIILATIVVAIGHFWRYEKETAYARAVNAGARNGDIIFTDEFDHRSPCPSEQPSDRRRVLPFSSCKIEAGLLQAGMTTPFIDRMGIYPTGETSFFTVSPVPDGAELTYYIETRFRTTSNSPLSACGISVEASTGPVTPNPDMDRSLMFHLDQVSGHAGTAYAAEVLSTFLRRDSKYSDLVQPNIVNPKVFIPGGDSLPFIGRASLPGWSNGTWTKLGVVLTGDRFTFLVNDRAIMSSRNSGLVDVKRASVAVLVGGPGGGSTATCEFDYLRVRRLPS